jgi:hypothetical protein
VTDYWTPEIGQTVWLNYPDSDRPLGKIVGFVPEGNRRAGQPIIECQADEEPSSVLFQTPLHKKGDHFVIAPRFLLPFQYYGEEWKLAKDEGRIE